MCSDNERIYFARIIVEEMRQVNQHSTFCEGHAARNTNALSQGGVGNNQGWLLHLKTIDWILI